MLEDRNLVRLYEMQHRQNLGALTIVTPDGVSAHWNRANNLLIKTFHRLFPWLKEDEVDEQETFEREVDKLNRLWDEAFGDRNDPETQKRIWDTAIALDPTLRRPTDG